MKLKTMSRQKADDALKELEEAAVERAAVINAGIASGFTERLDSRKRLIRAARDFCEQCDKAGLINI